RYANEFAQVAADSLAAYRGRLLEVQRHHPHVPFAILYCFLHAIELGLKSFMLHTGSSLDDLMGRRGVGHDLGSALDLCVERGLLECCPDLTEVLCDVIRLASETYSEKGFEYIKIGPTQLPHVDQVAMATRAILTGLGTLDMKPARVSGGE
ncbi:MAG: hypothetical protein RIE74_11065, partial [Pseudomonadales bacterium]